MEKNPKIQSQTRMEWKQFMILWEIFVEELGFVVGLLKYLVEEMGLN